MFSNTSNLEANIYLFSKLHKNTLKLQLLRLVIPLLNSISQHHWSDFDSKSSGFQMAYNFCSGSHSQISLCIIKNTKNVWFLFHIHFYCILYYQDIGKSFNYRPEFALFSIQSAYLNFRYRWYFKLYYVKY